MVMQNNLPAMNVWRCLSVVSGKEAKQLQKLASGHRINQAADDAAGLAISEKMRCQIRGLTTASKNAQDGISLIQTAEGALNEIHEMLQRANKLALQSANGINSEMDRKSIQAEWQEIKSEVDRVAATTEFNRISLLSGNLARKDTAKAATPEAVSPNIAARDVTIYEVKVTQAPSSLSSPAGNDNLKRALREEIVPQAISSLVNTFSNTFGYLKGSNIGIGFGMNDSPGDSTLAFVRLSQTWYNDPRNGNFIMELGFNLSVNTGPLDLDSASLDGLKAYSRTALEETITHEMMHAMMYEALTAGMVEKDASGKYSKGFPLWFIEGTAQAASGGIGWVKSRGGLNIDKDSTQTDIKAALSGANKLGSNTSASKYATGYLAAMYLGSLAGGGEDVASVASGLDRLLTEIKNGKSMDNAIVDCTSNRYNSMADFENKFAQDSATFVKNLLTMSEQGGKNGRGALAARDYTSNDWLPDTKTTPDIFLLNTDSFEVSNSYPDGYVVLSGGTQSAGGTAPGDGTTLGGVTATGSGTAPGGGTIPGGGTAPDGGTAPGGGLTLQIGANPRHTMDIYIEAMDTASLGIQAADMSTAEGALDAVSYIHKAINKVSIQRSDLGAWQNRLEHTISNLDNAAENIQSAESLIRDSNMAAEMLNMVRYTLLRQAGQAMLAQANQNYSNVLSLLS